MPSPLMSIEPDIRPIISHANAKFVRFLTTSRSNQGIPAPLSSRENNARIAGRNRTEGLSIHASAAESAVGGIICETSTNKTVSKAY